MRILTLFSSLLAGVLLVACQRPPTPNPEKPPVPKAMSRAMQEPLDRAKGAQKAILLMSETQSGRRRWNCET